MCTYQKTIRTYTEKRRKLKQSTTSSSSSICTCEAFGLSSFSLRLSLWILFTLDIFNKRTKQMLSSICFFLFTSSFYNSCFISEKIKKRFWIHLQGENLAKIDDENNTYVLKFTFFDHVICTMCTYHECGSFSFSNINFLLLLLLTKPSQVQITIWKESFPKKRFFLEGNGKSNERRERIFLTIINQNQNEKVT